MLRNHTLKQTLDVRRDEVSFLQQKTGSLPFLSDLEVTPHSLFELNSTGFKISPIQKLYIHTFLLISICEASSFPRVWLLLRGL